MRRFLLLAGTTVVAFALFQTPTPSFEARCARVYLGEKIIKAEVADTATLRAQGLSNRETFKENTGMLFIFERPGTYGFWMKDMTFAIDIIWIDATLRIVGSTENLTPLSFPTIFMPPVPVLYALEVPAGFVDSNKIKTGKTIAIEPCK